ncbi:MAG: apolipoprotein N-acyltransferase, partial [Abditibacteriota bacterium]|nr:apolipoprotein N-acyltransferase [Abditibacteriota bacterium]
MNHLPCCPIVLPFFVIAAPPAETACTATLRDQSRESATPSTLFAPELSEGPELSRRTRWMAAVASALLWWLAGQKWGGFALGWIALTPLLWALRGLDGRARFRFGWAAGVLCFALLNWWIAPTIVRGSPMIGWPPVLGFGLGLFAVSFIALVHGAQVAIVAWLWNPRSALMRSRPWLLPIAIAIVWGLLDWLRGSGQAGHMWGALAYTQWRDMALLQSASFLGQHGLSALCVWFAASLALLYSRCEAPKYLWGAPLVVWVALHAWGAWRIAQMPAPKRTLKVLLVQTDVPSLRKNFGGGESPFNQAMRLSRAALERERFDLVLWPETTALMLHRTTSDDHDEFSGLDAVMVQEIAQASGADFLVGARTQGTSGSGEVVARNEAVLINGRSAQSTAKERTVPFGERAFFSEQLPFLKAFAPQPPVDPQPGRVLRWDSPAGAIAAGVVICFESCFPYPAGARVREGAKVLYILTNDEWFAGTNAPWEHAAMATLRAVENDVPVVQV